MSDVEIQPRRPGRPSNAEVAARQQAPERQDVTPRQAETQQRRRRREGLGPERNMKLHVPEAAKDPNFVYRWVNERPGRVRQLTQMDDYEVVSSTELNGGDPDPAGNTAEGTVMTRTADRNIGEKTVLLKKPKDYYEKDKADEQAVIDERDKVLRKGPLQSPGGLTSSDNAYTPGGKNIIAGR